jgi:crotonobetainyl-CoA:carnitine CoA-transferase CaiB-like acyl-CoA transferase
VPCGSVRDVAAVLQDPHLSAREMIQAVEHATAGAIRVLGVPIKLSESPGAVRFAPPTLGQQTESILRGDLGLSAGEVDALRAAGVV